MDLNINTLDIFKEMFDVVKVIAVTAPWYVWLIIIVFLGASIVQRRTKRKRK